jgi:hypothetical protein
MGNAPMIRSTVFEYQWYEEPKQPPRLRRLQRDFNGLFLPHFSEEDNFRSRLKAGPKSRAKLGCRCAVPVRGRTPYNSNLDCLEELAIASLALE